jgi:hypothetical protein
MNLVSTAISEPFIAHGEEGSGEEPPRVPRELSDKVAAIGPHCVYATLAAMERFAAVAIPSADLEVLCIGRPHVEPGEVL